MIIKHDYSYLDLFNDNKLIEKGYAELDIHSINFRKHFTEEIKENNRKQAEILSKEDWNKHCDNAKIETEKQLQKIVEILGNKYVVYGYNEDKYKSDWDLFLSMRSAYMQIPFNKNRSVEQNRQLLNELLELIEQIDNTHLECTVQYTARENEDKIEIDANNIIEKLLEKTVTYKGMEGKIKLVEEYKDFRRYGFFKKRARAKYYEVDKKHLVLNYA